MKHIFTLNDEKHDIGSSGELASRLEQVRQLERADISLYEITGTRTGLDALVCRIFGATTQIAGQVMMAWLNSDMAHLLFEEDDGLAFHSCNPSYSGPEDAAVTFYLGGQEEDMTPARWCISREEALKAVMHFYEHGKKPEWIHWQKE